VDQRFQKLTSSYSSAESVEYIQLERCYRPFRNTETLNTALSVVQSDVLVDWRCPSRRCGKCRRQGCTENHIGLCSTANNNNTAINRNKQIRVHMRLRKKWPL